MGSGVHCQQCGKELGGWDQYSFPPICSACKHAEEVRKQGEEARKWRQIQEWEDKERAREQREWEEEQAEKERELRERELAEQKEQRELAERQQAHQEEIRREEIAYQNALPKCKYCGKQYNYAPENNSFYEYCSKKCAIEDLGKDKIDEYGQTGQHYIKKQINNAFYEDNNIYKGIVLSEGFSQFLTVQQHIFVANGIQKHRKYFLSTDELEGLVDKHYCDAFEKAYRNQKVEIICSALSSRIQLDETTLTDCHPTPKMSLLFLVCFCQIHKELSSREVVLFEQVFTLLDDIVLKALYEQLKKQSPDKLTQLLTLIDKENIRREEERMRQEEERKRQEEERKRQEEERKRQENIKNEIQKLTEEKNEKQKQSAPGCLISSLISTIILIIWGIASIIDEPSSVFELAFIFLVPIIFMFIIYFGFRRRDEENLKKASELEQKIKELNNSL